MDAEKSKDWEQVEPSSGGSALPFAQRQTLPIELSDDDVDDAPPRQNVPVVSPEKGPSDRKPAAVDFCSHSRAEKKGIESSTCSEHSGDDSKRDSSSTVESAGKRKTENECIGGEEVDTDARASKSARTQEETSVVEPADFINNRETGQEEVAQLSPIQKDYFETMQKNMKKKGKPTASYCFLKALYVSSEQSLSKQDLKKVAEPFYGGPMEPDLSSLRSKGFGAWSGINTLVKKNLVKCKKKETLIP
jgi:hypothetical protein